MRRWKRFVCSCAAVAVCLAGLACLAAESKEPAEGAVRFEHFAIVGGFNYLDGPRMECMLTREGRYLSSDRDGNWYIMWKFSTSWLRVIRADGMVETIAGDDHWTPRLDITEGPAAYMPNYGKAPTAGDLYVPGSGIQAAGSPLRGEEHGCIYIFFDPHLPLKVFRNREQNDRWWFKLLGKKGGAKLPATTGATAAMSETDLTDIAFCEPELFMHRGSLYEFDEAEDTVTCVLAVSDYREKAEAASEKVSEPDKKGAGRPSHAARAADGTIYLAYYFHGMPRRVFRISPDHRTVEMIVYHDMKTPANQDGPGLQTGWHCGPSKVMIAGESTPVLFSIDSGSVRRWQNGRVSVLCYDGQWREGRKGLRIDDVCAKVYQPAEYGLPYVHVHYAGEENGGDFRAFRLGPVDWTGPTVGPLVGEKEAEE